MKNPHLFTSAVLVATVAWAVLSSPLSSGPQAGPPVALPPPAQDLPAPAPGERATAVFAGGCFWGVQAVFQHTQGVLNAVSGYAGGSPETARYDAIGSGTTGHAESVQVTYDPRQISYGRLLQIFFAVAHDPTQRNRQGPDVGPQYRSALFFTSAEQEKVARDYIALLEAAHAFPSKIVTELAPLQAFYPAEAYHQDYATLHPNQPYIAIHDRPKIERLKASMPEVWREQPVLVSAAAKSAS